MPFDQTVSPQKIGRVLESFLPMQVLARLHAGGGNRPAAVEFPAAVMFVDVSRYTALVEQLARRGQEGLEKIPNLLNLSYARSVDMVYARGGEVIYLVGDAMLAYWAADVDGIGKAIRAAADCAEAICGNRRNLPGDEQDGVGPALHVGIGAGALWVAALGGQPVWSLVAGGDAVVQASRAHAKARKWEYVLSPAAELGLVENSKPERPKANSSTVTLTPPNASWLTSFLPVQLRDLASGGTLASGVDGTVLPFSEGQDRRASNRLDALADVRPVTALFARIHGIDHGGTDALARHQALCFALQEDLVARGGPAGELFFDDKGLVFTAVFGAPGTFHRDDPERAVDAACEIAATVRRLRLSTSVGVATGEALFRVVGNERRRQWMVLGQSLNRAARMMTSIADGVLCDAPTERASRDVYLFEQHGILQLDGLGDMAAVFHPLERRAVAENTTKLIGRHNELSFLRQTLDETLNAGKRLIVVFGESGIGKSALVNTFKDGLSIEGFTVSVARAERDDRRTLLLPWRRVIASLLNISVDSDVLTVFEQIADRVRGIPSLVSRLPLLDGFLGIEIAPTEATRHLDGAHRADATMRLLGDIIGTLAPRPLVVVLEDSQWLDSASWRLVEWVLASQTSMLLILCVRSEEVPEELKGLLRRAESAKVSVSGSESDDPARFIRILDLDELSDDSICELVALTLGETPPDEDLARGVATLAGGNPLFAEEIMLTLKSNGLIAIRDGRWRPIQSLDGLRYFEGVERVIRERIDRLDSVSQDVIKAAAIVGRTFTIDAIVSLVSEGLSRQVVESAVKTMVASRLVRQGSSGSSSYEFRHDQIRDVVYGSIPIEVRQRLHGTLATWMESNELGIAGSDVALLVQHFEAARNKAKAIQYAELAASEALQIGAFREVEAFLGICFSHETLRQPTSLEQQLQVVRWRRQLAEAHYSRGDIHAQGVWVRRALTLAGETIPQSKIALVGRLLGTSVQLAFQQIFPAPRIRSGVANLWEREMARCMNQAAMVDYFELRFLQGMRHLVRAVTLAEHTGITIELAVASAQLACGLGIAGYPRACNHFMAKAERTAIALGDPAIHSHVCNLDALWRIGHCDWPVVDRRLQQSQDLCVTAGDQLRWCNAQVIRFWSLYYRGEWGVLEQTAQALLSRAQNSGNIQQEVWALRCKSLCALHADNPREAVEVFRLITSAMLGSADLAAQVSSKGALALALARIGRHTESIQEVDECLRLLREVPRPTGHSTLVGISGMCEVLLRGREAGLSVEYSEWNDWERQALYELKRYSSVFPVGRPQFGLWTGVAQWLDGRKLPALTTWKKAMAMANRLSLRQDASMIAAELRRRVD